ncbi:peptidoglycan DD-metalloendopeptidase family protein [Allostreptomyces psammosilenae]|uniref:M23ase beta-sheet core domain-containing protein n=1 Tax=Allostreptomyces psammosilenae TaxID=1892865 RepID=A0A852ZWX2_9ACTN|nr:peptidoglycan DD-metalloendopeptidase family protein [Allostreptomyces psammosilenae]NYI05750.1 hypothetical protein [Allostreptomyces psammosilenae]
MAGSSFEGGSIEGASTRAALAEAGPAGEEPADDGPAGREAGTAGDATPGTVQRLASWLGFAWPVDAAESAHPVHAADPTAGVAAGAAAVPQAAAEPPAVAPLETVGAIDATAASGGVEADAPIPATVTATPPQQSTATPLSPEPAPAHPDAPPAAARPHRPAPMTLRTVPLRRPILAHPDAAPADRPRPTRAAPRADAPPPPIAAEDAAATVAETAEPLADIAEPLPEPFAAEPAGDTLRLTVPQSLRDQPRTGPVEEPWRVQQPWSAEEPRPGGADTEASADADSLTPADSPPPHAATTSGLGHAPLRPLRPLRALRPVRLRRLAGDQPTWPPAEERAPAAPDELSWERFDHTSTAAPWPTDAREPAEAEAFTAEGTSTPSEALAGASPWTPDHALATEPAPATPDVEPATFPVEALPWENPGIEAGEPGAAATSHPAVEPVSWPDPHPATRTPHRAETLADVTVHQSIPPNDPPSPDDTDTPATPDTPGAPHGATRQAAAERASETSSLETPASPADRSPEELALAARRLRRITGDDARRRRRLRWPGTTKSRTSPQPTRDTKGRDGTADDDPLRRILMEALLPTRLAPELFAEELLARAPLPRLQRMVDDAKEQLGELRAVVPHDGLWRARFQHGDELLWARLDANGRLDGFVLGPAALAARRPTPITGPDEPATYPRRRDGQPRPPRRDDRVHESARRDTARRLRLLALTMPLLCLAVASLAWVAGSATAWLLAMVCTVSVVVDLSLRTPWHVYLPWLRVVPGAALALALTAGLPLVGVPLPGRDPREIAEWAPPGILPLVGTSALVAVAIWSVRSSLPRGAGKDVLTIASPLRGGRFAIAQGGGPAVNRNADPAYRTTADRAVRYACDLVELGSGPRFRGSRARGLMPAGNDRYAVFQRPVHSPCDGTVVSVVDDVRDHVPGAVDAARPAGNHVAVDTGRVLLVLAHLRRGSITVRVGDRVTAGQQLGLVGNSGNTTEPALHVHLETRSSPPTPFSGVGVPFCFAESRGLPRRGRSFRA